MYVPKPQKSDRGAKNMYKAWARPRFSTDRQAGRHTRFYYTKTWPLGQRCDCLVAKNQSSHVSNRKHAQQVMSCKVSFEQITAWGVIGMQASSWGIEAKVCHLRWHYTTATPYSIRAVNFYVILHRRSILLIIRSDHASDSIDTSTQVSACRYLFQLFLQVFLQVCHDLLLLVASLQHPFQLWHLTLFFFWLVLPVHFNIICITGQQAPISVLHGLDVQYKPRMATKQKASSKLENLTEKIWTELANALTCKIPWY